jgi:hypothetical protein
MRFRKSCANDYFRYSISHDKQELRKQFQIISELRTETKTLQGDNLKLFEKVRYMQSYREDSGSRPVTQLDPLPPPSARLDDMSKYQARYEEAMNPFEAFRGRVCRYYCYVTVNVLFFQNRKLHGHTKISIQLNEGFLTLHVQFSETALLELSSFATRLPCMSLLCSLFMNVQGHS